MALLIPLEELISGNIVESQRIDYKEGWNPQRILHSICAFANDYHNTGVGYIIIGISEYNGLPVLPPIGIEAEQLDEIQKDIVSKCYLLDPYYMPSIETHIFQEKNIIVIQCYGADGRPYSAPEQIGKNIANPRRFNYIRVGSITKTANAEEQRQLHEISLRIPFDDRAHPTATIDNIDLSLIIQHLESINSPLLEYSKISKLDLLESMGLLTGPSENRQLRNIALMLFSPYADTIFTGLGIDIVEHKDNSGTNFTEKIFSGPIHVQLREALAYFSNQIQKQVFLKTPGQATTQRFYNYPYEAFKEALGNAVYHMGYNQEQKIEVQIFPDKIEIISWPGPLPPITNDNLKEERVTARRYRNRRLGDYLKELNLTEGRATGIPTIRSSLSKNGSEPPLFYIDEGRNCFKTTLFIHDSMIADANLNAVVPEVMILTDLEQKILECCIDYPCIKKEIYNSIKDQYEIKEAQERIQDLVKRKMLEVKATKFLFITINLIYVTSTKGKDALRMSF